MRVVDLADEPADPGPGVVVAVGDLTAPHAEYWLDRATFTLTDQPTTDRRAVTVRYVHLDVGRLQNQCEVSPHAAQIGDDVLRALDPSAPAYRGVITESLAYSTLQAGPEFQAWLAQREPAPVPDIPDPVLVDRDGDTLHIRFNRPARHNAFSTDARAALLDALEVARLDPSVDEVVLSGNGPSFCSGGDLAEFGSFADPAEAHLARTRYSPALVLDALRTRLGARLRAEIHGKVYGSGLEMAAFCGRVSAHLDTVLVLPELELGLLPGAGGTVSITRRIGRWRTAYLFLTGNALPAEQAREWGLVDDVVAEPAAHSPRVIRMLPEYSVDYPLWEAGGPKSPFDPGDLGLSEELDGALLDWAAHFHRHFHHDRGWDTPAHRDHWARWADDLAARLEREIAGWGVVDRDYYWPLGDA